MAQETKTEVKESEVKDFLLDSEKKDIEEKVLNEVKKDETIKEIISESNMDKGISQTAGIPTMELTKKELVQQFLDLQKTQGKTTYSEAVIKKMTKLQIIKLIANYTNEVIGGEAISETVNRTPEELREIKTQELLRTAEGLNIIAEGIFNMNLAFVSGTESLSVYFKGRTKDIAVLEGFTDNVIKRKEAFMAVFKGIYMNYKPEFDKYLSPTVQYAMIMLQVAAITIAGNVKKKDENSNPN